MSSVPTTIHFWTEILQVLDKALNSQALLNTGQECIYCIVKAIEIA